MVDNHDVARVLDDIANLLEIEEESPFRIRAHRNAADTIRFFDPPLETMVAEGQDLTTLQDVGAGLAKKITEIVQLGPRAFVEQLEKEHSPGLLELLRLPGLGPKKVRTLRDSIGVASLDSLRSALEEGRLEQVPGFGPKSIEQLRSRLARLAEKQAEEESGNPPAPEA